MGDSGISRAGRPTESGILAMRILAQQQVLAAVRSWHEQERDKALAAEGPTAIGRWQAHEKALREIDIMIAKLEGR